MARPWYSELAVFDLETTGVDVESCRIVSAHVGVLDATGAATERWSWLADPGVEIPDGAAAVHGITTEHARRHGRPAREVVGEIVAALDALLASGLPLVVYNAPYDLTLLDREARRHGVAPLSAAAPIVDPLVLDRAADRYRRGKRTLQVTAQHYGVELTAAHDAGADAVAAGRVAQAIARRYPEILGDDGHALHDLQVGWCADQASSFEDYMRRTKDPAFCAPRDWPLRPYAAELLSALDGALGDPTRDPAREDAAVPA